MCFAMCYQKTEHSCFFFSYLLLKVAIFFETMDEDAADTGPPLLLISIRSRMRKNVLANRRQRLLAKFLEQKSIPNLVNAEEETVLQRLENEVQDLNTLPYDLLFRILISLPGEHLFRLQFVSKKWFSMINSSIFITSHAQQSETVLFSLRSTILEPEYHASLPSLWPQVFENKPRSYFHFLNLDQGDNNFMESSLPELLRVRANCDGLVLATLGMNKNLILMNPVTRKHNVLPLGTEGEFVDESFGIAFCNEARTYKVVHLFHEISGCTGYEILNISTGRWTKVDGSPPCESLHGFTKIPVSIGGSLYWLPRKRGCEYLVSMCMNDEKFITKKLPVSKSSMNDRLLEIGGNLGFVARAQVNLLQVWILNGDGGSSENWINQYSVNLSDKLRYSVPICSSRNGNKVVLESRDHQLYVYNFEKGEMKLIQTGTGDGRWFRRIDKLCIPHRNTLLSWDDPLEI